jgi:hypothetical protein
MKNITLVVFLFAALGAVPLVAQDKKDMPKKARCR